MTKNKDPKWEHNPNLTGIKDLKKRLLELKKLLEEERDQLSQEDKNG